MATYVIQLKRGRAASWVAQNPVLNPGEPGFELDTNKLKIGNGVSAWNDLPYINEDVYSLSPDGNSLAVSQNTGELTIYGFEEAEVNQIPVKNEQGQITWVSLSATAFSGLIEDLQQKNTIEIYGGSATDVMEV